IKATTTTAIKRGQEPLDTRTDPTPNKSNYSTNLGNVKNLKLRTMLEKVYNAIPTMKEGRKE
ncbi:hypothetical protein L195_g064197, partial [Trifolium pratense]